MDVPSWMKFPGPNLGEPEAPTKKRRRKKQFVAELTPRDLVMLVDSAGCDDSLDWCEECGAPMELDDPARATADDFCGCWYALTGDEKDRAGCKRYLGEMIKRARLYTPR